MSLLSRNSTTGIVSKRNGEVRQGGVSRGVFSRTTSPERDGFVELYAFPQGDLRLPRRFLLE